MARVYLICHGWGSAVWSRVKGRVKFNVPGDFLLPFIIELLHVAQPNSNTVKFSNSPLTADSFLRYTHTCTVSHAPYL